MYFKHSLSRFYCFLHGKRAVGLFFFLAPLLLYISASPFRDMYGIEVRNALFTREMLENGISFIPNLMGRPYPDYPPLYFLLEYIFSLPSGRVTAFSAVLPSALSAAGTVWLLWRYASRISPHISAPACLILAAAPGFYLKASHATLDMLLAFETFAAFYFLSLAWPHGKAGRPLKAQLPSLFLSALFMFAACITKGPVGFIIPAGAWGFYLVMEKRWQELTLFGIYSAVAAIVIVIIYGALIYWQGGWPLISKVVENQVAGRMGTAPNRPWYYYTLYIFTSFLPWWLLAGTLPAIIRQGWLQHSSPGPCMNVSTSQCHTLLSQCAAGMFTIIALFSVASSRHGRYLLPAFPFMAVLIAAFINIVSVRVMAVIRKGLSDRNEPFRTATISVIITAAVVIAGLVINSIFIEPGISRQESGRIFMEKAESSISSDIPIVIYRINPDGDGLKIALYSSRSPDSLVFARSDTALSTVSAPEFLLITYEKRMQDAENALSACTIKRMVKGLVHSKQVAAMLVVAGRTKSLLP